MCLPHNFSISEVLCKPHPQNVIVGLFFLLCTVLLLCFQVTKRKEEKLHLLVTLFFVFLANDVLILAPCTTAIFFWFSVFYLSKYSEQKAGRRSWELVRWWRNLQKIKFIFHLIFYPVWRMSVLQSKTIFGSQIASYFVESCSKKILTASISCKMTALKFDCASTVGTKKKFLRNFFLFVCFFNLRWIAI